MCRNTGRQAEAPGDTKLGPNHRPLSAKMENLDPKFFFFILRNSIMPLKQRSNVVGLNFLEITLDSSRKNSLKEEVAAWGGD